MPSYPPSFVSKLHSHLLCISYSHPGAEPCLICSIIKPGLLLEKQRSLRFGYRIFYHFRTRHCDSPSQEMHFPRPLLSPSPYLVTRTHAPVSRMTPLLASGRRNFTQSPRALYPRKDSQDKDSMNVEANEYTKSSTDDEAARQEEAAFDPSTTDPKEQMDVAGKDNGVSKTATSKEQKRARPQMRASLDCFKIPTLIHHFS